MLHGLWRCPPTPGLVDILANPEEWQQGLRKTGVANLHFIPAGRLTAETHVSLESAAFDVVLARFRSAYDTVLFVAPPVHSSTDAAVLSSKVDVTCLVLTFGVSRIEAIIEAKAALEAVQGKVIGAVLTAQQGSRKKRLRASQFFQQATIPTLESLHTEDRGGSAQVHELGTIWCIRFCAYRKKSLLYHCRKLLMKVRLLSRLDHHMHEVLRGASIAFVLKVLNAILDFVFNVMLARLLGAEGAGIYFLALTVSTVAEVLGSFGLDNTLLRFTAANAAVGDWRSVKGAYTKALKLALGASSSVTITIVLAAPWLAEMVFSEPAMTALIRWMAIAAVPVSLFMLHAQLLKGLKRVGEALTVHGVCAPTLLLLGTFVLAPTQGVQGVVWAYLLAAGITLGIAICLWRRATPQLHNLSGQFDTGLLLSSSIPLFWTSVLQMVNRWSSMAILGIWGRTRQ